MNVFSSAKTIIFAFAIDRMNPGVHCLLPLLLLLRYFSKKKKKKRTEPKKETNAGEGATQWEKKYHTCTCVLYSFRNSCINIHRFWLLHGSIRCDNNNNISNTIENVKTCLLKRTRKRRMRRDFFFFRRFHVGESTKMPNKTSKRDGASAKSKFKTKIEKMFDMFECFGYRKSF